MKTEKTIKKRNGEEISFDSSKIVKAILSANKDVSPSNRISAEEAEDIAEKIKNKNTLNYYVEEVQNLVEEELMKRGYLNLAKEYILFRYIRSEIRTANTTDDSILGLIANRNRELADENSNKNALLVSTQRDLMAGEVSKDLTNRKLLPEKIVKAHEDGILHFHDKDYFIQPIYNCCLINIEDMLVNGTVMNGKAIESPKSFQVACTVMTQIIAAVASSQYGGQSVNIKHLGRFLKRSEEKIRKRHPSFSEDDIQSLLQEELTSGVQTIQYQINTLMTTNGQTPFVTLFLELDEKDEFLSYTAKIIEEILKQRTKGIKNEQGVYVTPTFPKLIYVLDEHNAFKGGEFDYLTELAVRCSAKRMYPDYISAKKMREIYEGQVFSCMGCRSFLAPWKDEDGNYKWEGRFNQGVVSLNLPQIAIIANGNYEKFYQLLEERLALCFEALMCRHKALEGVTSDVAPLLWQHGAIARLKKGEKIDKLLHNGYSTISLGYIGVYEMTKIMTGESHTTEKGKEFALKVMKILKSHCETWKKETGLGFGLYGTPAESLCYRFAKVDKEKFGSIPDVTDKGYYTNSYHVDVREKIDAFSKLSFESEFQKISTGGCISYVEIPNMNKNIEALRTLVKFIYDNIQYAEFNTKFDFCQKCGYEGEVSIDKETLDWVCPQCGNRDRKYLSVTRRTCGYLGANFWNVGKTKEIISRVTHL